jgi:hypothetical protein
VRACTYLDAVRLFGAFLEPSGVPTRLERSPVHVEEFIAVELER